MERFDRRITYSKTRLIFYFCRENLVITLRSDLDSEMNETEKISRQLVDLTTKIRHFDGDVSVIVKYVWNINYFDDNDSFNINSALANHWKMRFW